MGEGNPVCLLQVTALPISIYSFMSCAENTKPLLTLDMSLPRHRCLSL